MKVGYIYNATFLVPPFYKLDYRRHSVIHIAKLCEQSNETCVLDRKTVLHEINILGPSIKN